MSLQGIIFYSQIGLLQRFPNDEALGIQPFDGMNKQPHALKWKWMHKNKLSTNDNPVAIMSNIAYKSKKSIIEDQSSDFEFSSGLERVLQDLKAYIITHALELV